MPDNILNIGAGKQPIEGALNMDRLDLPGIDLVHDITSPLPLDDETFDRVVANYVLCQIASPEAFVGVLNDIHRVLKPEGILEIRVPNANYPCAFQDPMDCRYFVPETFDYLNKDHYRYTAFNYGFKPWHDIIILPERGDRLLVTMRKYVKRD